MKVRTWDGTPFNVIIVKNEFQIPFRINVFYEPNFIIGPP
jgi:hypothetical protein